MRFVFVFCWKLSRTLDGSVRLIGRKSFFFFLQGSLDGFVLNGKHVKRSIPTENYVLVEFIYFFSFQILLSSNRLWRRIICTSAESVRKRSHRFFLLLYTDSWTFLLHFENEKNEHKWKYKICFLEKRTILLAVSWMKLIQTVSCVVPRKHLLFQPRVIIQRWEKKQIGRLN